MERIKLFTHTDLDGIGCAVLAKLAFGDKNVDIDYCNYDDIDKKVCEFIKNETLERAPRYDYIYITDISINEETAKLINEWNLIVMLLDHHATALWLNDYHWANVRVKDKGGVKTSGTKMFYRHLCNEGYFGDVDDDYAKNVHKFVEMVRDYDTWRWKEELGEDGVVCKELNDLFYIYGRDKFIEWCIDKIVRPLSPMLSFPSFDSADRTLLDNKQKEIDIYVESKNKQLIVIEDRFGHTCGVVFAERFASELGNRLSEKHPELDYIIMIDLGNCRVSYRTAKDGIDLGAEIAHAFGGGGHPKAAGSMIDNEVILGIIAELFGERSCSVNLDEVYV